MGTVAEWGPAAWKFLHAVTFAYPETPTLAEQVAVEQMFGSLRFLLPCAQCRTHYETEIRAHPPDTRSRATLSAWLVDLHNRVNLRLGKGTVTYREAEVAFSSQCSRDCGGSAEDAFARVTMSPTSRRAGRSTDDASRAMRVLALLAVVGVVALIWVAAMRRRQVSA